MNAMFRASQQDVTTSTRRRSPGLATSSTSERAKDCGLFEVYGREVSGTFGAWATLKSAQCGSGHLTPPLQGALGWLEERRGRAGEGLGRCVPGTRLRFLHASCELAVRLC